MTFPILLSLLSPSGWKGMAWTVAGKSLHAKMFLVPLKHSSIAVHHRWCVGICLVWGVGDRAIVLGTSRRRAG